MFHPYINLFVRISLLEVHPINCHSAWWNFTRKVCLLPCSLGTFSVTSTSCTICDSFFVRALHVLYLSTELDKLVSFIVLNLVVRSFVLRSLLHLFLLRPSHSYQVLVRWIFDILCFTTSPSGEGNWSCNGRMAALRGGAIFLGLRSLEGVLL